MTKTQKPKKTFVLDSNILLHDPHSIKNFGDHNVVIPFTVLEELDKFKSGSDDLGFASREAARILDGMFPTKEAMEKGHEKPQGGIVRVQPLLETDWPLENKPDNRILACAAYELKKARIKSSVILVTKDVNLRLKARSLGIRSSDLQKDREITHKVAEQKDSTTTVLVSEKELQDFYGNGIVELGDKKIPPYSYVLLECPNGGHAPAKHMENGKCRGLFGPQYIKIRDGRTLRPRNLEQSFLIDALYDDEVGVVTVFGKAGTGKTLCAIAAALNQMESKKFDKVLISRAIIPMGKDIGFLPGTEQEKMRPWVQPCYDAIEYLYSREKETKFDGKPQRKDQKHRTPTGGAKKPHEVLMEAGVLEIEVLAHIRGRSIPNAFFVVDELQNSTKHEVKTIVTRMSEGSKIVLIGDPDQIDNPMLDRYSNGLAHAASKLSGDKIHAHVCMVKGERSEVAELAAAKL